MKIQLQMRFINARESPFPKKTLLIYVCIFKKYFSLLGIRKKINEN